MADEPRDTLDELIGRLERAADDLRTGDLSADAAAALVEECAGIAGRASTELERRARETAAGRHPELPGMGVGQDPLL